MAPRAFLSPARPFPFPCFHDILPPEGNGLRKSGGEIDEFEKAQQFFGSFQKNGDFHNLRKSLDILDELINIQGRESERAARLKGNIRHCIDSQMDGIYAKTNLEEFSKGLDDDQAVELLLKSLSQEDFKRLMRLFRIKKDYFG